MTNQELSEKFALEYAGWTRCKDRSSNWNDETGTIAWNDEVDIPARPCFADSVDAVLPYLESWGENELREINITLDPDGSWHVLLQQRAGEAFFLDIVGEGRGTLARAIVEALLQTKNVSK